MPKNKYIESPDKMWELFSDYKKWAKENPILIEDYVGKNADRVMREKPRCLTMEGFENYVANKNLNTELSHYFSNKDERYSLYIAVCSRVKREIRQDQIEGGMAGVYNPSITQRLNNLVERKDLTSDDKKIEQPVLLSIDPLATYEEYDKDDDGITEDS